MASIQFGSNGEVISEDYSGSITDPSKDPGYSDEQLAAALPFTEAKGSTQQIQLDKMSRDAKYMVDKANAVRGFDKDGVPQYVESAMERARLLNAAKGLRASQELQLEIAKRSLAADYLDQQAAKQHLIDQAAAHDKARARAVAIAEEEQAQQLAKLFMRSNKMTIG